MKILFVKKKAITFWKVYSYLYLSVNRSDFCPWADWQLRLNCFHERDGHACAFHNVRWLRVAARCFVFYGLYLVTTSQCFTIHLNGSYCPNVCCSDIRNSNLVILPSKFSEQFQTFAWTAKFEGFVFVKSLRFLFKATGEQYWCLLGLFKGDFTYFSCFECKSCEQFLLLLRYLKELASYDCNAWRWSLTWKDTFLNLLCLKGNSSHICGKVLTAFEILQSCWTKILNKQFLLLLLGAKASYDCNAWRWSLTCKDTFYLL